MCLSKIIIIKVLFSEVERKEKNVKILRHFQSHGSICWIKYLKPIFVKHLAPINFVSILSQKELSFLKKHAIFFIFENGYYPNTLSIT